MSRNFDLLAEMERERESGSQAGRASVAETNVHEPASVTVPELPQILRLVRSVFLTNNGASPRRVVFFGVEEEGGSGAICAQAARALAQNTSKPVCAVDANVRSARLSQALGIAKTVPIADKFSSLRDQCMQIGGNLWLAGTDLMSNGQGFLLPVDELRFRITQLSTTFEFLLIDAPGAAVSQDAELLAHLADGCVMVIEANKTRRTAAAKAKESLDMTGVRLLGTVLKDRTFPIPERLYKFL
jgi:Mrp family chromosome partitioning ATPase